MIRKYTEDDLDALLDTWYQASLVAHSFLSKQFLAAERIAIQEKFLPAAETWVYEERGRVVGFVAMIGEMVGGLFVTPSAQRRGIGQALLDHVRPSRDRLEVEVFTANEIGHAFYVRYGFETVGTRMCEESGFELQRMETVGGAGRG